MILASGCFDGLHAGHVAYLTRAARRWSDQSLVVAVASDGYIFAAKGRKPTYTLEDRMRVIHALGCVDRVVSHNRVNLPTVIREMKPSVFVKGTDWHGLIPDEIAVACREVGAEIVLIDSGSSLHTSHALSPVPA